MTDAQTMLDAYMTAELAILKGKTVKLGERLVGREDLAEIIKGRKEWEQRVAAENAAATKVPTIGGLRFSVARFD